MGEKWPKNWLKNGSKWQFSHFSVIIPPNLPVGPKSIFFGHFFPFRACGSVPGKIATLRLWKYATSIEYAVGRGGGGGRSLVVTPLLYLIVALSLSLYIYIYEQRHLESKKAKTFRRHFCRKHHKTRCTPEKRDQIKNPRHGHHPERDQNEIGTRYKFVQLEAIKGQDRVACQYTLGFSLFEAKCPETPIKRDTHLKNEISRNLGKLFAPPLISRKAPSESRKKIPRESYHHIFICC